MGLLDWLGGSATDDEPAGEQRKDVLMLVSQAGWKLYSSCDEIPGSSGRFGYDGTNPIPVNGPVGETVYLNRLRAKSGIGFLYHRIGTVRAPFIDAVIDRFELVALDASQWAILNLCPYFPRRSLKAPDGMSLARWKDANATQRFMLKRDSFGRRKYVENFPLGLPEAIANEKDLNTITPTFAGTAAARMQEYISAQAGKWVRPYKLTPELTGAPVPSTFASHGIEPSSPDATQDVVGSASAPADNADRQELGKRERPPSPDISAMKSPVRAFMCSDAAIFFLRDVPSTDRRTIIPKVVASSLKGKPSSTVVVCAQRIFDGKPPHLTFVASKPEWGVLEGPTERFLEDEDFFLREAIWQIRQFQGLTTHPVVEINLETKTPLGVFDK